MIDLINTFRPLCGAIGALLPNDMEIVLHDLGSGTIAHIENGNTNRSVGDPSMIDTDNLEAEINNEGYMGPYTKAGSDGTRVKSVTFPIRDDNHIAALLCINLRLEKFDQMQHLLKGMIGAMDQSAPQSLFRDDWRERAHSILGEILSNRGITLAAARKADKIAILAAFEEAGLFEIKNSADYFASLISISRASLYAHLKEARSKSLAKPIETKDLQHA